MNVIRSLLKILGCLTAVVLAIIGLFLVLALILSELFESIFIEPFMRRRREIQWQKELAEQQAKAEREHAISRRLWDEANRKLPTVWNLTDYEITAAGPNYAVVEVERLEEFRRLLEASKPQRISVQVFDWDDEVFFLLEPTIEIKSKRCLARELLAGLTYREVPPPWPELRGAGQYDEEIWEMQWP